MWRKKLKADGKVVCSKHYSQFKKHSCFRDNSPRTKSDKNNIVIKGDIAIIDLYDNYYNVIAQTMIDAEDVDRIKNIKWRLNCNGYAINGKGNVFLHRKILNCNEIVDHENGDRLDNRKENLRIATKSTNQMNVNYKGVSLTKNGRWYAHIKKNQKMINLGIYIYKAEALYARWYAERIVFKEFAFPKEELDILESRKSEIKELVERKVQRL